MKCAYPDCEKKIRSDNRSGVCQSHHKFQGKCKKCFIRCWVQAEYCKSCDNMKRAFESRTFVPCQFKGCKETTTSHYKLCEYHFGNYKKCRIDGCDTLVKFNSKWGYCEDHRHLTRYHKEDKLIPVEKPDPLPLKRKRIKPGVIYEIS